MSAPLDPDAPGEAPPRAVRVPDALWTAARARAAADGVPLAAVIRAALDTYAHRPDTESDNPAP